MATTLSTTVATLATASSAADAALATPSSTVDAALDIRRGRGHATLATASSAAAAAIVDGTSALQPRPPWMGPRPRRPSWTRHWPRPRPPWTRPLTLQSNQINEIHHAQGVLEGEGAPVIVLYVGRGHGYARSSLGLALEPPVGQEAIISANCFYSDKTM